MPILMKNNLKNLKYLNNCDLINKYNLKTSHGIVVLNKIKLSFSLLNFIETLELKNKKLVYLYKIPYLCLSLYFSKCLKINYNSFNQEYTLEIVLTNLRSINNLLHLIFIENQNCFETVNGMERITEFNTESDVCYTYLFPASLLNGLQEIMLFFFPKISLKKLLVYIKFFFSCHKGFCIPQNFLHNSPFFCTMNFIPCNTF